MLTQEQIKKKLVYDPETGIFTWNKYSKNTRKGQPAGYINDSGYVIIGFDQQHKHMRAHRLAFLYMTGSIPEYVDHIDRDRQNNKWSNLRAATQSENGANMSLYIDNTTGYRGICYLKGSNRNKRWVAKITKDSKVISLGYHFTKEEAAKAYDKKALELFGEYANLNFKKGTE